MTRRERTLKAVMVVGIVLTFVSPWAPGLGLLGIVLMIGAGFAAGAELVRGVGR